jgi:hypothetical protein
VPASGRAGSARLWRQTSAASRTGEHDVVCDPVAVAGRPCWSRAGPPPASSSAASGTCRRINGNARTSRCPTRRTADLRRRTADLHGVNSVRCGARTSSRCGGGDDDCRQHHQRPGRDVPGLRTGTRRRPPDHDQSRRQSPVLGLVPTSVRRGTPASRCRRSWSVIEAPAAGGAHAIVGGQPTVPRMPRFGLLCASPVSGNGRASGHTIRSGGCMDWGRGFVADWVVFWLAGGVFVVQQPLFYW